MPVELPHVARDFSPAISFIIPAHNEVELLGATLDALTSSATTLGEPFEIIVVDDASTDGTAQIAARPHVSVVTVSVRHIAAARNAGAKSATGELLVFIDADTLVNPSVISAAVKAMREGAVGGGAMVAWEGRMPIWARSLATLTRWTMRAGNLAAGCFVFATRSAFDAVGGFDRSLYATEEIALSRALKRVGRFVLLREEVTTSGRKLRAYSALEMLAMTAAVALRGWGGVKDRRHLPLWYGKRRPPR